MSKEETTGITATDSHPRDELQQLFVDYDLSQLNEAEQISADATASDEALITRLRGGDNTAYTALWVKHVDAALRVARRVTPGHAEDLVSEGFIALYQGRVPWGGVNFGSLCVGVTDK